MHDRRFLVRRALAAIAAVAVITGGALVSAAPAGAATTVTGYRSIPTSIPGNLPSQPFQAQQTSEFGDAVTLASSGYLSTTRVLMSSWGCQSGAWNTNDCVTTPGATFAVPITFNLYTVVGGEPGSLIGSKTQTFNIPFRPSASGICTGGDAGKWYDAGSNTCFNGFATPITFDFSTTPTLVPSNVIWTVSYNTSGYGPAPLGYANPCNSTPQGCGYDSLNVALDGNPTAYVGTDADSDGVIWNTATAGLYCDGGTGGSGTLRHDTAPGCWAGYRPAAELNISSIPLLSTSSVTVAEGNGGPHTVNVPVNLSAPTTNTVTVKWKTRYASALPPSDYSTASGVLTFAPGEYSKTVPITVIGDTTAENYEKFYVDFTSPTNATLSPPGTKITSTVTLQNDDLPALKYSSITTSEGAAANLSIALTKPLNTPVVVTVNSTNGTAVAPGDYTPLVNYQITFPAGSVAPILVPVNAKIDGVLGESLEKFTVTASSPSVVASLTRTVNISANNT